MNYDTSEYQHSEAAVAANALTAYNNGATGTGVKIGIVDTGINASLSEFAGRVDPASRDVAGNRPLYDATADSNQGVWHGSAVADVAAGARNNSGILGVAFNSTIVALRADDPGSCATTSTTAADTGGCSFYDSAIGAGIDAARLAGARVINLSLGGSAPGTALLAAIGRAANAGIVLVIAAGNDGDKPQGANADPFALSPAQHYPGSVIIAGSIGQGTTAGEPVDLTQLSDFSNRAGTGAVYYLAARGQYDTAVNSKGTLYYWSGTSFSAPAISGAAALLAQAFPNLTGKQIVSLLLNSADDLGAPGVDSTFGHGALNLARAFQPVGTTTLAGSAVPVSTSANGDLPAVAGDAAGNGPLGVVILDGYSRAYALDLAKTLRQAQAQHPLANALAGRVQSGSAQSGNLSVAMTVSQSQNTEREFELTKLGIGPNEAKRARLIAGSAVARLDDKTAAAFGFAEGSKAMERRLNGASSGAFLIAKDVGNDSGFSARRGGGIALRRQVGPVGVTLSAENGNVWQEVRTRATGSPYRLVSVNVDKGFGSNWLSAGVSRLDETRTLLGGQIGAALGGGGSSTLFFDVEGRRSLGRGISAALSARRGFTSFGAGRFQSDAYAFDLTKDGLFGNSDRIGFRLSQPLRIATGGFAALLPTGFDYSTMTANDTAEHFSLSPSGRELDAELSYGLTVLQTGWFGGNLFIRRQPGHIAAAGNDPGAAVRFSLGF